MSDNEDTIQKYEKTGIYMFKAKNGKSVTIPIDADQFVNEASNGKLVLNVSLAGLLKFLQESEWKKFGLNKIREV